jgi:hypothetical protein
MARLGFWTAISLLLASVNALHAVAPPPPVAMAISRALPLLVRGAKGHIRKRDCFGCHNQASPLLALTSARDRGFVVYDDDIKEQLEHIAAFLDTNRDNYRKGRGQAGQADTAGYALLTLAWGGWKADETTSAVVEFLLRYKAELNHWTSTSDRPPSEASPFTTTFVALRGLRQWGTADRKERIDKRIDTVRGWLGKAAVRDTEDRVFRLWALAEAGVPDRQIDAAVKELLRTQRKDGGWAQIERLDSDAYATGTALVALHRASRLPTSDEAYQRGIGFLLKTQLPDGSWLVRSRSRPFQTYYESGFPHGKDQFISMAASGWAVAALALSCPEVNAANKSPSHPPATGGKRTSESPSDSVRCRSISTASFTITP